MTFKTMVVTGDVRRRRMVRMSFTHRRADAARDSCTTLVTVVCSVFTVYCLVVFTAARAQYSYVGDAHLAVVVFPFVYNIVISY